jgi:transcriptional regulator with XRE-family HTH domain
MVLYRKGGVVMYKERIESCGQRIAKALTIKSMRQSELCKLANVPKSSLSLYLSGAYEPKQDRIYDMARVLNVNEAWLMGYDVPMEKEQKNPP